MTKRSSQSGFTAVELLITLFVAAAFLIAGYQLFNVVIKDGGQARAESTAGNVAYDYLRRYAPQATNPCTAGTVLNNADVTVSGLSNVKITVEISCPSGYGTTGISKIEATITYNTPQQTAKYSTFTNGIVGNTPLDVTNGLIGWWKLNGNANDQIANNNGSITGASSTTGQNGVTNNAYSFNGTSDYVSVPDSDTFTLSDFSISVWVQTSSTVAIRVVNKEGDNSSFGILMTNGQPYFFVDGSWGSHYINNTGPSLSNGAWHHILVSRNGSTLSLFEDGSLIATRPNSTTTTLNSTVPLIFGRHATPIQYFPGKIDDVRLYNRALSPAEITTLYTGGAK